MERKIELSVPTSYCGRNGWGTCIGFNIWKADHVDPPVIFIYPINSRNKEAAGCHISICITDIESFIELLRKVATEG